MSALGGCRTVIFQKPTPESIPPRPSSLTTAYLREISIVIALCHFELGVIGGFARAVAAENDDGAIISSTPSIRQIDQHIAGLLEISPRVDDNVQELSVVHHAVHPVAAQQEYIALLQSFNAERRVYDRADAQRLRQRVAMGGRFSPPYAHQAKALVMDLLPRVRVDTYWEAFSVGASGTPRSGST